MKYILLYKTFRVQPVLKENRMKKLSNIINTFNYMCFIYMYNILCFLLWEVFLETVMNLNVPFVGDTDGLLMSFPAHHVNNLTESSCRVPCSPVGGLIWLVLLYISSSGCSRSVSFQGLIFIISQLGRSVPGSRS